MEAGAGIREREQRESISHEGASSRMGIREGGRPWREFPTREHPPGPFDGRERLAGEGCRVPGRASGRGNDGKEFPTREHPPVPFDGRERPGRRGGCRVMGGNEISHAAGPITKGKTPPSKRKHIARGKTPAPARGKAMGVVLLP